MEVEDLSFCVDDSGTEYITENPTILKSYEAGQTEHKTS